MANNSLPQELLLGIFERIRAEDDTGSVAACLGVSKEWYCAGYSALYHDIVLDVDNAENFVKCFNVKYAPAVRSLTMRFDMGGNQSPQNLDLEKFADGMGSVLPHMSDLVTFSLTITNVGHLNSASLALTRLVNALPEKCTNLELDFPECGEIYPTSWFEPAHVCKTISQVLPRMENVRLKLPFVCSSLFGDIPQGEEEVLANFEPISLPRMKSFLVSCITSGNCPNLPLYDPCCSEKQDGPQSQAWHAMTEALQVLVKSRESCSPSAQFFVTGEIGRGYKQGCSVLAQTEMVSQTKVAFPSCVAMADEDYNIFEGEVYDSGKMMLLRTLDNRNLIGRGRTIAMFVENLPWMDGPCGQRQPSAMLLRRRGKVPVDWVEKRLWTITEKQWEERGSGSTFPMLETERDFGRQMCFAERRSGPKYLCTKPRFI